MAIKCMKFAPTLRMILLCCTAALNAACEREVQASPSSVTASALQAGQDIELFISGKGFTPRGEIEIRVRNYPGRIGDIVRGTTADSSGSFVYREFVPPIMVKDPHAHGDIIISAWDTSGGVPPAVTSKPPTSFVAMSPAGTGQ